MSASCVGRPVLCLFLAAPALRASALRAIACAVTRTARAMHDTARAVACTIRAMHAVWYRTLREVLGLQFV